LEEKSAAGEEEYTPRNTEQPNIPETSKVAPAGIEPASSESESEILSIEIRSQEGAVRNPPEFLQK
jgi:hypothetical protein